MEEGVLVLDVVAALQRLNFAADYFAEGHLDRGSELAFAKENLFDILGCTHLSVWEMDDHGDWKLYSQAGDICEPPPQFHSWAHASRSVVGAQHAQCFSIGDGTFHWALPLRNARGGSYVAHLRGTQGERDELLILFLSVSTKLLVSLHQQPQTDLPLKSGLSHRQEAILKLMAEGKTYKQISSALGFSVSLVKQEAIKICRRLGVKSRYEAVDLFKSKAMAFGLMAPATIGYDPLTFLTLS